MENELERTFQDARDKRLISFSSEDLVVELLRNEGNKSKVSLALANTKLTKMEALDKKLVKYIVMN